MDKFIAELERLGENTTDCAVWPNMPLMLGAEPATLEMSAQGMLILQDIAAAAAEEEIGRQSKLEHRSNESLLNSLSKVKDVVVRMFRG